MTSLKVLLALLVSVSTAHAQGLIPPWQVATQSNCPAIYRLIVQSPETVALLETSNNYTIFCPTDRALSRAGVPDYVSVKDLLRYHVVLSVVSLRDIVRGSLLVTAFGNKRLSYKRGGRSVQINSDKSLAFVVRGDIRMNKGFIHVIDRVLIPNKPPTCTTIYGAISRSTDLSTLKALVDAAGLATYLQNSALVGTVFAPTNKAFDRLFRSLNTNAAAVLSQKSLLVSILNNHVIPGAAIKSTQLRNRQRLTTLSSTTLVIGVKRNSVTVESRGSFTFAKVTKANTVACKSIVHVIDRVLLPTP